MRHRLNRWREIAVGLAEAMRPGMWLKPLFLMLVAGAYAAHDIPDIRRLLTGVAILGTILWGGLYMLNDVMDVADDRAHPIKRHRPFASGRVPLPVGAAVSAVLISIGLALSLTLGVLFGACAVAMTIKQFAYSMPPLRLKRVFLWDVVTGSLFNSTLRFTAGWVLFKPTAPMPLLLLGFAEAFQLAGFLSSRLFTNYGVALEQTLGYANTTARVPLETMQRTILACWGVGIACFSLLCLNSLWRFEVSLLGAVPMQAMSMLVLLVVALLMFGKALTRLDSLTKREVKLYHDLPLVWVLLVSILFVLMLHMVHE